MLYRIVLAICVFATGAFGQQSIARATHVVTQDVTLSSAATAVTIQQPASASKSVQIVAVFVSCAAACDVTLERTGTAATTTLVAPTPISPSGTTCKAHGYTASDVGTGTVITRTTVPAGNAFAAGEALLPALLSDGTGVNFTVRIGSMTGRVIVDIYFREN